MKQKCRNKNIGQLSSLEIKAKKNDKVLIKVAMAGG